VIAVHLEGVANGRRLFESVRATTPLKPVIVLPVGKADLGGFAESHTGNLMGAYELTCAALRQAGAVVVETTDALIDGAHALSHGRLPPLEAPGIGILTGQAGPGLLITDKLRQANVAIPEISPETVERIRGLLPPLTYIANPVDTGRPLESFDPVCDALAGDPAIDAMLVYALHEEDSVDFAAAVGNAARKHGKPTVFATQGRNADINPLMRKLERRGVTAVRSPDRAATAVRALAEDARARWAAQRSGTLDAPLVAPKLPARLDEASAKGVLDKLGISTPGRVVCGSREAAAKAFDEMKRPAVVKILDTGIAHKTDVGGVHVGVRTRRDLDRALDAIDAIPTGRRKKRYLLEETAADGIELIVGARNDRSWGPVVLAGLGGTAAEAYGDVAMRLAPLNRDAALEMIGSLRAAGLLDGFRGAPAVDREAVADLIVRLGEFVMRSPGLREVDLNPVRAYPDGVRVLDAVFLR
jgi:acyl-CoA synthetase (NDP forming)